MVHKSRLILSSIFYGCLCGSLFAAINIATHFFVEGQILSALWFFLFGPLIAAVVFGVPWLVIVALNAVVMVGLVSRWNGFQAPGSVLLLGGLVGVITTRLFYIAFLEGLILEDIGCDAVCLGLDKQTLGRPFWHWILLVMWTSSLVQLVPLVRCLNTHRN